MLLAGALGVGIWGWPGRPPSVSPDPTTRSTVPPPETKAPEVKPLTVRRLRVTRIDPDGNTWELGEKTYRVFLNERVEVEAELSEPAYTYLIAFNPADKPESQEQYVPKSEAERPPEKRDRLDPDTRLTMDDGVGLQAFAVVASRQPLPAYTQWLQRRPPLPWERIREPSKAVWVSDGEGIRRRLDGLDRATEEPSPDKALVRKLGRALKGIPGIEAVSVVGFAVVPAE
jgi:hypothetical protein